jgi:type VI secretion system ImpC/EvpB family protein
MVSGADMSFTIGRAGAAAARRDEDGQGSLFRVLVLGDFSGRASRQAERDAPPTFKPTVVDIDTLDAVLARVAPQVQLELPQAPGAPLRFSLNALDDFEPDALYARFPLLARLRDLRSRLSNPATFEQAAAELRADERPAAAVAPPPGAPAADEDTASTMARLLGGSMPSPTAPARAAPSVASAVDDLIRRAVAPHVVPATAHLQQPLIDSVDRAIGDTVRAVLGHPHWRSLEGAWRSVDHFVRHVEMDGQVLLEIVDASAADLLQSLMAAGGDAAAMPLAKTLKARRLHEGQEEGYALVVGLYEFGPSAPELALLAGLGALAAGEGAVFIGSGAPALALIDAPEVWSEFVPAGQADAAAQARWKALRASWVAPHVGLVWPQVLGRLPYGARTQPVSAFSFEELPGKVEHRDLPWRLAALDAAALLAQGYVRDGWDLAPEDSVEIEDLPAFTDRSGDDPRFQAVAELFMTERQAQAVMANGVMALISHRALPHARLAGWRSIASSSTPGLKGRWNA